MRRNNNNMGRGMGGRGGGGGGGIGGPLMTDHLQDLELELELLKRKRQLIQEQQNEVLYRPNTGQTAFNQPRQMFEDSSHLYGERPRGTHPPTPKRQPVPVWDSVPGDRFSGPPGPSKRPRPGPLPPTRLMDHNPLPPQGLRPQPSLLGPTPLMNFFQKPPASQNTFKRNVKPTGPNRPNLSPKNSTPNKPTPNKPKKDSESFILTAEVQPRSKVGGRLEFAVGALVKEMKSTFNNTDEQKNLFVTTSLARVIKQAIRERLHTLMLGKVVGSGQEVLAEYRKAFPPSTDADLIKLAEVEKAAQERKGELAIKLLEEGDPELYFKKNMTKLLEVKLDEMFQKVQKSYESEHEKSEIVENLPEMNKAPTEEPVNGDGKETGNAGAKKNSKEEEYDKWIALLLERKLPELLAKHKNDIIKALDLDAAFRATKAAIYRNANNKSLHIAKKEHNFSKIPESGKDDPVLPYLSYFAKVHASPCMPKRKLMQDFLNQFNPKTIKRHKKNFNLLFIGFNNKEDYDRILKADQTKIGTATITIVGNTPKTDQPDVIEIKDEDRDSIDQVLTPQLDDQINDLLTSIRKADEEVKGSEAADGEAMEVDLTEKEATNGHGSDGDVQEVNADAEVVAIEDDDAAAETDAGAPLSEEPAPAPETPAKPAAPVKPATPSTVRTRRASRLAQSNVYIT